MPLRRVPSDKPGHMYINKDHVVMIRDYVHEGRPASHVLFSTGLELIVPEPSGDLIERIYGTRPDDDSAS